MKQTLTCLLLLCCAATFAQNSISDNDKLASLGQVWGLLKYHHPAVVKGKRNWDKELMDHVGPVMAARNNAELNKIYTDWLASLGRKQYRVRELAKADSLDYRDYSWLDNKSVFTDTIANMLRGIAGQPKIKRNKYAHHMLLGVSPLVRIKEKPYADSIYPSVPMRLLALYRYWNVINYYYPYKNVLDHKWNDVLPAMVPLFVAAADTIEYNMAIRQMIACLDDSHASLFNKYTRQYFGLYIAPFMYDIVENKVIVKKYYNDTLAAADDIRTGDIVLEIDGKTIEEKMEESRKFISASNEATRILRNSAGLFFGKTRTVAIKYDRDGVIGTKTIKRYLFSELNYTYKPDTTIKASAMLPDNIGYVNMGVLTNKQVKKVMGSLMNTRAIIFDVRNYPNGTMYKVQQYLNAEKKQFVKFSTAENRKPGVFKFINPYKCGKNTSKYYKGKVIVLFNASTQSHAEFTCMALKTAPDVTFIGSQTAGADGNVVRIALPGGITTSMTGLGVFYPDGTPTQRIGIVPDITVTPTLQGLRMNKDEVLDRAVQFVKTGR